ncbi:MAG: putative MAPEG superfamily protein [Myxococcota bacterium]|jgi:uncharacterized MAPEG superfamily protein
MTTDLWMLAAAALLTWILIMADATPGILNNGIGWASGNRDVTPDPEGLHGRLHRASENMKENLPLFAVLVLVVHVAGEADPTSAIGAQVFVCARVLHAIVYAVGVPWLRTAVWGVSIVGMGMVASAML